MRRRLCLVALMAVGAAWGQGVVVRPPEVEAGAKPELVPQVGHSEGVHCVAWSPDGRWVASASCDGTIVLWDVAAGAAWHILTGHQDWVYSVAFSPDGRTLASGSGDDTVRLWDVFSGKQRGAPLQGHTNEVDSVAFSPDGRTLVSGSWDGTMRLWDVATGQPRGAPLAGHTLPVRTVAFSPDGRTLASGSNDNTVRLWDVPTRRPRGAGLAGHTFWVLSVSFSPDGRTLASGSGDKTARLWDVATRQQRGEALAARTGSVDSIAFSPDGQTLASGSEDGTVRLWDLATGQPLGSPLEGHGGWVRSVAFSPDGRRIASGSDDQTLRLWNVATRKPLGAPLKGHTQPVHCVAFSPDGRTLASGSENTVRLWDVATGEPRLSPLAGHRASVESIAFSPDGRALASASWDGTLLRWDAATGELRGAPLECRGVVYRAAFSLDGGTLATEGEQWPTVQLWDVAAGRPRGAPLAGQGYGVASVAFSPDGQALATGSENEVQLWEVETGRPLGDPLRNPLWNYWVILSLTFSPDGRTLASGSADRTVQLWDVATGQPRGSALRGHSGWVYSVAFSPDGRTLASGSGDSTVRLWDVSSRKQRGMALVGHTNWVTSVAFSTDGRKLASGSKDGSVRFWETASGRLLASLFSLDTAQGHLLVTPAGYYDSSVDAPNVVVWRIGHHVYPFDQFSEKFNRPDLVRRALAGEDISNAPPLDATQLPPNLGFMAPQYGAEVKGDKVDVELHAAGKYPIRRLDLTVNGTPLPADLARQLEVEKPDQTTRTFKLTVPLPPNEPRVRLRAVAYDAESLKSRVEEITLFRPGMKAGVGALYVLAVGINKYPKLAEAYQLRYAVPDAQAVAERLGTLGGGKPYTEVKSKLLCDDQATVTSLKFALRELKDAATENDVAVIFVSGHGVADKAGAFYFPTCEVDLNDIPGTALSWQDFVGALREVRAKRVMVLADTCHSGAVVGQGQSADEQLAKRLNKEGHRLVFAASGRDEVSVGKAEWAHGAFSKALLEALEGKADGDKDGQITFAELRDYVPSRVSELTENRQHPQLPFLDSFEPEAVLAMVR